MFYRITDERIVSTSEDECLDIRRELCQIFPEQCIDLRSWYDSCFDQWYESWGWDLLYNNRVIEDIHTLTIHTTPNRSISCKDSYPVVSPIDHCLSSWHRDAENMISNEYLCLEVTQGIYRCRITSEDNYVSSASMESLYSCNSEHTYLISTPMSIRSIRTIHLEDHLDLWEFFLELSHHDLSTESWVKKSDTHELESYIWVVYMTPIGWYQCGIKSSLEELYDSFIILYEYSHMYCSIEYFPVRERWFSDFQILIWELFSSNSCEYI